jgi:hypothetical protein
MIAAVGRRDGDDMATPLTMGRANPGMVNADPGPAYAVIGAADTTLNAN